MLLTKVFSDLHRSLIYNTILSLLGEILLEFVFGMSLFITDAA